jgi:DNA-binding MarR family transcriptional regulator
MADTSLEAYRSLSAEQCLQPKERAVMALFAGAPCALTREQIAATLGWKESAVCGRINSLVTKGELVEINGGKTASGRSAKLLKLPTKQLELV